MSSRGNLIKSNQRVAFRNACKICGEAYITYISRDNGYCCCKCSSDGSQSAEYSFVCEYCGKEHLFKGQKASKAKYKKQKYCNKKCVDMDKVGKFVGKNSPTFKHGLSGTKAYNALIESKRRAKKINQTLELTPAEQRKIDLYYRISDYMGPDWNVDHIIPISRGGSHHPNNLRVIPAEYNFRKHDRLDEELDFEIPKYFTIRI